MKKITGIIFCLIVTSNVFAKSVAGNITNSDTGSVFVGILPTYLDWFDDFIGGTVVSGNIGDKGWNSEISGADAAVLITSGETNSPGLYYVGTGSTATGRVSLFPSITNPTYSNIKIAGLDNIIMRISIGTLSSAPEEYIVRFGFGDVTSADFVDGVYFEYDRTTSVNWQYCTASGSTRTKTTSSVAVSAAYHKLQIRVSSAKDTVEYYVDGVSLGKITTNIPTDYTTIMLQYLKTVGSTGLYFNIDYVRYYNSTPR
ncbi:MAG: hypothetical protein PHQ86_08215 [Dehalococcoidales bacterium]|nr:hypothetical protein [Dehalococcoidales bacterium]